MGDSGGGSTFLAILALAAMVGVIFLYRWLVRKAAIGINRAVHKGQHQSGQAAAGSRHLIIPGDSNAYDLLDEIYRNLPCEASPSPNGILNATLHKYRDGEPPWIRVSFGKKMFTFWTVVVHVVDDELVYYVEDATMSDGLVSGAKELVVVQDRILDIARRSDPQVRILTLTGKVNWK